MPYTLFVATDGDDSNPGTKELPLSTLEKARDTLRDSKPETDDAIVYLRGGVYELLRPVLFDDRDSGVGQHTITYMSYPGEQAVLCGGTRVQAWTKADHPSLNMWQAHLPRLEYTRHLYVNGIAAPRPRSEVKVTHGWDVAADDTIEFWNLAERVVTFQGEMTVYEGYRTTKTGMAGWRNPGDIEFVYDVGWTHSICPVESVVQDGDQALIRMRMPCFRDCQIKGGVQIGKPSYMENVFELMDTPGQWYFDRSSRTLYVACDAGNDIRDMDIVVPHTEQLIVLRGNPDRPVRNMIFSGLELSHTTWLRPSVEGHAEVQANLIKDPKEDRLLHSGYLKPTSAVELRTVQAIEWRDNVLHHLGCGAIDIEQGEDNRIVGNHLFDIGGSGIQLGGFTFQDAHQGDERLRTRHTVIANNYLHEIGSDLKGSVAIIAGYTEGTVIAHNEIHDVAYSGISVGWGWGYVDMNDNRFRHFAPDDYPVYHKPSVARNNRIEFNDVHHVMRKLHDGGGIYTLSMQPESKIVGNYVYSNGADLFYDDAVFPGEVFVANSSLQEHAADHRKYSQARGYPGGIYMDEATGGFEVTGNVVHDVAVPILYHEIVKDRFRTNRIYGNIVHVRPGEPGFPQDAAEKAGLEPEYRHRMKGMGLR